MPEPTVATINQESRGFTIVVFVVSGFFVGFSLANIIYFNRIRSNGGAPGVTRGEATAMLWVNAILFGIALIIWIWSIYRWVTTREYRQRIKDYLKEPPEGYIEPPSSESGLKPRIRRKTQTITTEAPEGVTRTQTLSRRQRRRISRGQGEV